MKWQAQFKVLSNPVKHAGQGRLPEIAFFDEDENPINDVRIPGENPDCEFVSTWIDDTPGDDTYGFRVTKQGNVCNANGYVTGKAVAAGASVPILTIPPEWSGGAGTATSVCLGDNSVLDGGINLDNDGNVLGIAMAPGVALLATDSIQINYTWIVRHV
jgi:hypothetical protein